MAEQSKRTMDGEASGNPEPGTLTIWPSGSIAEPSDSDGADGEGVLDTLFSTNAAPILLIDPGREGAIVDANPRAAAFYGYSRKRLRSLHVWDINQLGRAILPAMHEIASWEGGHYPQRFHHKLADGSVRDVQVYAGPIRLGGRKLLLCIIHDITAVIEAEQFNRLLLENVQVGVCGIDRAGAVTFVNPTAVRAFGFHHESEVIRNHIGRFLFPTVSEGSGTSHPVFRVTQTGETARDIDATLCRGDGTPFPVRLTASPISNNDGIAGVVVSFVDLTEEREREAQASDLANALPGAVFQAELHSNGNLRATYFSTAAASLFGVPPDADLTTPQTLALVMGVKGWARVRRSLRQAGQAVRVWEGEMETAAGRWVLGRAQPRRRGDGVVLFNGVLLDITDRKGLEAELQQAAMHDPLTGLWNRRRFQQAVGEAVARLERYGRSYILALIDIDHFKHFNDMHGHQAGDDALRVIAATLSDWLRRSDALARWGGEEFALLLTETDLPAALSVLETLRQRVEVQRMDNGGAISISIGVGQAKVGEDIDSLLQRVDAALYRAKAAGRNRVEQA